MGQTAVAEGGQELYTVTLPPGMFLCTNQVGAMRLLNRSRGTIWNYVQAGRLRSFTIMGNEAIPLADIAAMLDMTENEMYNIALAYRLPLWQIYPEGG